MKQYKTNAVEYSLRKETSPFKKAEIKSSKDSSEYIRQFFHDDIGIYESCFILLMNQSNITIGYAKISQGGVTGTVVDPMLVAKYAIESLAKAVIICHNHPSGQLKASQADLNITEKVKNGLQLFDIRLLDHIILTEESYYSFADNGEI